MQKTIALAQNRFLSIETDIPASRETLQFSIALKPGKLFFGNRYCEHAHAGICATLAVAAEDGERAVLIFTEKNAQQIRRALCELGLQMEEEVSQTAQTCQLPLWQ